MDITHLYGPEDFDLKGAVTVSSWMFCIVTSKPIWYCLGPFSSINNWLLLLEESISNLNFGLLGYDSGWFGQPPAVTPFHSPVIY